MNFERVQMPAEMLERAARVLVEDVGATRVWVFGSRARWEAHEDSDIDLYFTVKDKYSPRAAMRVAWESMRWLRKAGCKYDVFACTDSEFEEAKGMVWPIEATVDREGVLIYG